MSVVYSIKGTDSESTREMNAHQIMAMANNALQGTDKQVMAVTPDGLYAQVSQAGKQYTVPVKGLLQAAGVTIASVAPPAEAAAFDLVNPAWRYAISNLEDDSQREAYLKGKIQKERPGAEIVGSGRDWYLYDAPSGKWQALTNSPGFDLADLSETATVGGRIAGGVVGTIAGGTLGTALGPAGTVGGSMAGSAGGTALAEAATRGIAALDPDYRSAFDMGKATQAGATSAVISGAIPGVARGVGLAGRVMNPTVQGIAQTPVSSALRGAGAVAEGTGNVAQIANLGSSQVGKTVGSIMTPGLNTVSGVGALAQVPSLLTRGGNWVASKFGRGAAEESSEGILRQLGGYFGGKLAPAATAGRGGGINLNPSGGLASDLAAKQSAQQAGANYGASLGRGFDSAQRGGQSLLRGAEEAFSGISRATAATGRGIAAGGRAMQAAGQSLRPFEPAILQQSLARGVNPTNPGGLTLPDVRPAPMPQMRPQGGYQQIPVYNQYPTLPQGGTNYLPGYMPYDLEI